MSQSKASGRKSVAGMGSIRKKEKVINGKAYTYYEARYTVGIDPGTGKQIQKSISGKTQRELRRFQHFAHLSAVFRYILGD